MIIDEDDDDDDGIRPVRSMLMYKSVQRISLHTSVIFISALHPSFCSSLYSSLIIIIKIIIKMPGLLQGRV